MFGYVKVMSSLPAFRAISDAFSYLDDWEERYRYMLELGRRLPPLTDEERNEHTRVHGCTSQVWLVRDAQPDQRLHLRGDSDAHLVKGLVALVLAMVNGLSLTELHQLDMEDALRQLGLEEHLTPQRSNGVRSMLARVRELAKD